MKHVVKRMWMLIMLAQAVCASAQEFPVRPYLDPAQLDVPFGKYSYYKQPWRAYQDTISGYDFQQGIGINYNAGADIDVAVRLLAETGFKSMRIEIGWGGVRWDEAGFIREAYFSHLLEKCRQYHIRPVILLHAHHGKPCPLQTFKCALDTDAPAGSTSLHLSTTAEIVPGRTGIDNLKGYEAAWALITEVNPQTGECRLSRPLPKELKAGEKVSLSTLKYLPLYPVGTAEFEATAAGWVRYALLVCRLVRQAGIQDFDVEIWNEMSNGSDFTNINKYYQQPVVKMPDVLRPGGSAWELTARTVVAVKRDYPGVRLIWGFSNTTYFHTRITELPPGIDGQSYHAYGFGRNPISPATEKQPSKNLEGFVPTMQYCIPESRLSTFIKTESLLRLLEPPAREQHPPGTVHFYHYMTEHGVMPAICGVHDTASAWELKAKAVLRTYSFWLNKGITVVDIYSAYDKQPDGWGMLPLALPDLPQDSSFTAVATPPMRAIHNLTQAFSGSVPLAHTQPLNLDVVALGEQRQVFAGDSTHPPLWDRDLFAALPFQVTPQKFILAIFTKTYDILSPPGEERYRLTIRGLPDGKAHVGFYDPLQDATVPVKVVDESSGHVTVEFSAVDYPRLLTLTMAES